MNGINQTPLANATDWEYFVKQNSDNRHWETGARLGDSVEHNLEIQTPASYPCTVVYYHKHEDGRAYICYGFVYPNNRRNEQKNAIPKGAKRTAWDNIKKEQFFRFNFNSQVFKKVGDGEYRNENNELYVGRPTKVYVVPKPASWSNNR